MMPTYQEPDDVDFVVASGPADPETVREVGRFIEEYRRRPEYAEESRRARAILAEMGIVPGSRNGLDPDALLEHWKRTVAELDRDGLDATDGAAARPAEAPPAVEVPRE